LAKVQTNNHNQQSNETLFDLIKLRMQKQWFIVWILWWNWELRLCLISKAQS